jgi:hypothetical protein
MERENMSAEAGVTTDPPTSTSTSNTSTSNTSTSNTSSSGEGEDHPETSSTTTTSSSSHFKIGSFGEAPGFNVSPLQVFKVPDTLTTQAISANYAIFVSQRPETAEVDAVRSVVEGLTTSTMPLHFCGVSSSLAVSVIEACRREKLGNITIGTCPRYLHFTSEMLSGAEDAGPVQATLAKCSPPVRNRHNQRMLVEGLSSGAITTISTLSLQVSFYS